MKTPPSTPIFHQMVNFLKISHFNNRSVKEMLTENKNIAPGFDALRIILAVLILFWHSFYICYPEDSATFHNSWSNPFCHPFLKMILPMFFFLSGFLVCASAYRLRSAFTFLWYRALRILPALLVEIFLSAVFLGGAMTTLPLKRYFSSEFFFKYFLNIFGNIQFYLPGVFHTHPSAMINANLWTLPSEFDCYSIMAVLMGTRIIFNRRAALFTFSTMTGVVVWFLISKWNWGDTGVVFVRPTLLVYSFYIGAFFYIFCDKIKLNNYLFFLSIIGLFLFNIKYTIFLGIISSCYLCLCIGFINLKKFPTLKYGDYSYGIYLYSFPIQQTVWHLIPIAHDWLILFAIAFPLTLIFSVFSWKIIEKPFLKLKHVQFRSPKTDKNSKLTAQNVLLRTQVHRP